TGDERYLGYAHTLVAGRDSAEIDSEALILAYAALLQRGHRFEEALVLLDTLVERVPNHGQANLMSAYINVTLGRPQKALEFCRDIEPSLGPVMSLNCASSAKMLQGKFDQSYKLLSNLLARAHMSAVERMETLINLAEISKIRGDYQGAKKYFNRLLDEDPGDTYVLARLADTYTTSGQYDECIELLKNRSQPSLQLRYAIALKNKTGEVENSLQESLHEYFSVQLAREPELSSRDYALYLLSIKNQAESALDVSLKNWKKQREIPDTELVLRAAWQARQTSRVDEVLSWVEETGLQDRDINNLLAQFKDK
nr:tetratricopeptide repeat protein [Cellvibrionaceae bacterium]